VTPTQTVVVGIDGGGTKTRAVLADERGEAIADVVAPASAVRPDEADRSASVIADAVRQLMDENGHAGARPRVLCAGVAGVGREPERQALWHALVSRRVADDVVVETDLAVAFADAFDDRAGVLLVAGTGSSAVGRGPAGAVERCGGWGPVFGDEGGGAWIGRRALSVVAAATDGREPETALTGAILTALELSDPSELIAWAAAATPSDFATLAPVVIGVADNGDLRANSLVSLAVEELSLHVRALARRLFVDERASVPVAFTGGLLRKGGSIRKRLEHRLKTSVPGAQLVTEEVDAARGAIRFALRHLTQVTA